MISSSGEFLVIMSSLPQNRESAISMLVLAVFEVFMNINLYLWEMITGGII